MIDRPYLLSFTAAGSLLKAESVLLAERFLALSDWEEVQAALVEDNLLQSRTESSAKRIGRELVKQLQQLDENELKFLITSGYQDQGYLLWLAVCRCYRFLGEFAVEVLHERFVALQATLSLEDYEYFYTRKSSLNEKLANLSGSTQYKLGQVTFKMLRDAELLADGNIIVPAVMSKNLAALIAKNDAREFSYFPIFEADVSRLI